MLESTAFPYPVVLASASPRRHELLARLVPEFTVRVSDVDEDALTVPDPWVTAETLAMAKAKAVALLEPDSLVIGGDTVVAIPQAGGYRHLSKPKGVEDAVEMLMTLSGRIHQVVTGVALVWPGGIESFSGTSEVTFRTLSEAEIREYVQTGEPMDKAGGYAIQGGAAGFVTHLTGSATNVIGLPLEFLEDRLRSLNPPSPS